MSTVTARPFAFFALLLAFAVLAPDAQAQSRRELAQRIDQLEARLAEMESRNLAGDPVAETLLSRVESLEGALQDLTRRYEELAFENRQLQRQLESRAYSAPQPAGANGVDAGGFSLREPGAGGAAASALDEEGLREDGLAVVDEDDPFADARARATRRLGEVSEIPESLPPETDIAGPAELAPAPAPVDTAELTAPPNPDRAFQSGRNALYDGDFAGAQERFLSFVETYPSDNRIGEAHYWLGETYFVSGDYGAAAESYVASLGADPRGEKAGDSFVRLAASLAELGETGEACGTLDQFEREFPNADPEARRKARREALRIGCS